MKKNFETFWNRYKWQIFSRIRLEWYFFLKMSFHPILEVFMAKIRKNYKVGKARNYAEETEKNAFTLLAGILNNVKGCKKSQTWLGVLCPKWWNAIKT